MSRYFTKKLAALEPYTPGEQLKLPDLVQLNANENPYPTAPGVAAAVAGAVPGLRLYSDLTEAALCAACLLYTSGQAFQRKAHNLGLFGSANRTDALQAHAGCCPDNPSDL